MHDRILYLRPDTPVTLYRVQILVLVSSTKLQCPVGDIPYCIYGDTRHDK